MWLWPCNYPYCENLKLHNKLVELTYQLTQSLLWVGLNQTLPYCLLVRFVYTFTSVLLDVSRQYGRYKEWPKLIVSFFEFYLFLGKQIMGRNNTIYRVSGRFWKFLSFVESTVFKPHYNNLLHRYVNELCLLFLLTFKYCTVFEDFRWIRTKTAFS